MTKKIEGIIFVLIGFLFIIAQPVTHVDLWGIFEARSWSGEQVGGNWVTSSDSITLYSSSILIYLIGILFIILGGLKIRSGLNEKT